MYDSEWYGKKEVTIKFKLPENIKGNKTKS